MSRIGTGKPDMPSFHPGAVGKVGENLQASRDTQIQIVGHRALSRRIANLFTIEVKAQFIYPFRRYVHSELLSVRILLAE
jgi:hypothetical protein